MIQPTNILPRFCLYGMNGIVLTRKLAEYDKHGKLKEGEKRMHSPRVTHSHLPPCSKGYGRWRLRNLIQKQ
jgi:hypothetical protein